MKTIIAALALLAIAAPAMAAPPTFQNAGGIYVPAQGVFQVPAATVDGAVSPIVSGTDAATSLIAKASAGNLFDAYCSSSVAGRCILYNSATVPAAGALTPSLILDCAPVAAGGTASFNYNAGPPERFSSGVVVLFSSATTCATYTVSATAYIHARAQ